MTFSWYMATRDIVTIAIKASGIRIRSNCMTSNENVTPKIVKKNRSRRYTPTLVAVEAMNAVTAEGAYVYAFGSHR